MSDEPMGAGAMPEPEKKQRRPRRRAQPGDGPITTTGPLDDPALEAAAQAQAAQIVANREAFPAQPKKAAAGSKPSSSLKDAMKKVQARVNAEHAERARLLRDPNLRQLQRQGYKVLPPTVAHHRAKVADPTIVIDGDGKHVGHEGYKKRLVPNINRSGTEGDGEMVMHDQQGWVVCRYREDDPAGKFKAGDIVRNGMGTMVEMSPDDYAELWLAKHPHQGLDPEAFAEAESQKIMEEHPDLQFTKSRSRRSGFREERITYTSG